MLVKSEKIQKEGEELYYVEAIFDSANILKTLYFPHRERLYISFNRGGTYSYGNIDQNLYDEFVAAPSQGKFHAQNIKGNPKYPFRKEFTLYPSEIRDAKESIVEGKKEFIDKLKDSVSDEDRDLIEGVWKIYHQTYGFSFDSTLSTDPKFKSLLLAFKAGYALGIEEGIPPVEEVEEHVVSNEDELYNTIELMRQALIFYATDANYLKLHSFNKSFVELDHGSQAEFALKTIEKLTEDRKKQIDQIGEIVNKITSDEDSLEKLKREFKGLFDNE
jgi:hypothetical protein